MNVHLFMYLQIMWSMNVDKKGISDVFLIFNLYINDILYGAELIIVPGLVNRWFANDTMSLLKQ